jgi:hypothetical protein
MGVRLVQYCVHFYFHDCEWLLLVLFITLLYSRKRTEFGKPHAYRGLVCTSRDCQWYGEPYFVGAAILINKFLSNLMNVLMALASTVSMCKLNVILLSKIAPRYFTLFTNGMFRPFNVRRESGVGLPYFFGSNPGHIFEIT